MKVLSGLLLICLSLQWQPASAVFPLCTKQTLAGKIQDVLTPVRHYGPVDRRGYLSEKAAEFKLTRKEIAQIRKGFGIVFCQPDPTRKPVGGGAFLADNNCEIWTVGHNLQDDEGNLIDLKYCGFQNFEIPGKRTSFDLNSRRNIVPWVIGADRGANDRARLRLKDCIPGAKPFLVEDEQMPIGTEYMSVMAKNYDMPMKNEPILGPGRVEDIDVLQDGTRLLYTSNDEDTGASGGVDIVRSKGQLAVRAMHIQIKSSLKNLAPGGSPPNGAPYNRATNYNIDLELSGPVLKALRAR